MPDDVDPRDMTPDERRALGIELGLKGEFLEHFVQYGGFEELDLDEDEAPDPQPAGGEGKARSGPGDWAFIDEFALVQDCLVHRFAVKTASDWNMWKRQEWPDDPTHGERWPVRLMHVGRRGDELWWFRSPPETWEHLCGRAGWALVRAGRVVVIEMVMMN